MRALFLAALVLAVSLNAIASTQERVGFAAVGSGSYLVDWWASCREETVAMLHMVPAADLVLLQWSAARCYVEPAIGTPGPAWLLASFGPVRSEAFSISECEWTADNDFRCVNRFCCGTNELALTSGGDLSWRWSTPGGERILESLSARVTVVGA